MQLDFLDDLTPQATILAFPPRRLTSLIREAAKRVHAAGSGAGQELMNEAGLLQLRYCRLGFSPDEAALLADRFEEAVVAEVWRLRYAGHRSDPRGAA